MKLFLFLCDSNKQDYYVHSKQASPFSKGTIALCLSMLALLILSIGLSIHSPVFAQISSAKINSTSNQKAVPGNHIILKPAGTSNLKQQPPILTNISSKGIYKVQLRWRTPLSIQFPLLPKSGFQMEIDFFNASSPASAIRGESSLGMPTIQPNIRQGLVPVDSFDMTIYSNNGKVLWNKTSQAVSAGRAAETIPFNGSYTGPITILINNIKSSNVMTGNNVRSLSTPLLKGITDSVKFTAKVG